MSLGIPYGEQPKYTILNGTLSSSNPNNTANTTALSALAVYHAMQGILTTLPTLPNLNLSSNTNELSINLFAESYGGKYAPAFASLWSEENAKLRYRNNSQTIRGAVEIKLKSVGIINGCVDDLIAGPYYAQMANNNTYALRSVSDPLAASMNGSFYAPSGCRDQILECRSLATSNDPDGNGDDISTNLACLEALSICYDSVIGPYAESGRSMYDIAQFLPESFPSNAYLEYLNSKEVLDGIGSPVNFTVTSSTVVQEFTQAGDHQRDGFVPDYAALLAEGIRVSFIYGDRDYICNWLGGEAISLAVAKHPPSGLAASEYGQHFPAAGYAPIIVNDSYIGGEVRQFANLSFARIYDAGHLVPSYQPETAFQVFARVIHGLDIGTGAVVDEDFSTSGPPHTRQEKRKLPPSLENVCWIRDIANSCTPDQAEKIREGKGTVVGGVFYEDSEQASKLVQSQESARSTKTIGGGTATVVEVTTVTGSTPVLTGMYTATSTPDSGSASMALPFGLMVVGGVMAVWMGV